MFRPLLALPALVLLVGFVSAADPDPRSPPDVFGKPHPHGEPVEKGFIGLYAGRTNLAFGQPMQVELFAVNPNAQGPPYMDLPSHGPLELTDAAGKTVPFRLESGGERGVNGFGHWTFTPWPTKDHAAGIYWKPGTYKLKMSVVTPNEQPPAKKLLNGTFRTNELVFTVREFGAAPDTWDGKGKLRSTGEGVTETNADMFLYVAGLDDESSERLRKTTERGGFEDGPWKKVPWRVAAAQYAPVTVPQDRELTDAEVKKLIADLKDKDAAVRVRAVRSVPPTAPAKVFAAAAKLLLDPHEQGPAPFGHAPTYPLVHIAADALCRLGTPAVEPLIAFAEEKGHQAMLFQTPPRQQVAVMLGRIGPNDAAEKYLRAAIRSGDDDRVGAALATAKAWGKGGIQLTRAILALPKVSEGKSAIAALGAYGDLKTDGPTLRLPLASTDLEIQWAAISALAALRDTDSLPALRKLLASTDPGTRSAALSALMALGDTASVPEFERLARDVNAWVGFRWAAVDAVQSLADAKTSGRLVLDLMGEKNMRYDLLWKAGRWKILAALPLLLDALDDADESIRHVADYGLGQLADHPAGVGYDAKKPVAKLWRDYWAKKEKK